LDNLIAQADKLMYEEKRTKRKNHPHPVPASPGQKALTRTYKGMFVYTPDTRIKVHTVKLARVSGRPQIEIMEGTFTKPMPTPDGKTISPTGKTAQITMCTAGHWKNGVNEPKSICSGITSRSMKQIVLAP